MIALDRYIFWQKEKDILEYEFQESIQKLSNKGLSTNEIIDKVDMDEPYIVFNFKYYLPGIKEIEKRLLKKYNLYNAALNSEDYNFTSYYNSTFAHNSW